MNKVTVKIANHEYTIVGEEKRERVFPSASTTSCAATDGDVLCMATGACIAASSAVLPRMRQIKSCPVLPVRAKKRPSARGTKLTGAVPP